MLPRTFKLPFMYAATGDKDLVIILAKHQDSTQNNIRIRRGSFIRTSRSMLQINTYWINICAVNLEYFPISRTRCSSIAKLATVMR
uniref:Uncharacterized protein n=1 Tax=Caenorhabditis japonica TaxID=281687 RepID=A0A8R1IMR3_CAEJA